MKAPHRYEPSRRTLKFRVVFYTACLLHELILAAHLLPKDLTVSKDPHIARTHYMKHILLTTWNNYFHIFYFIISAYVDWKQLRGEHNNEAVQKYCRLRHSLFTSHIFPITLYTGSMFWTVWILDREMLVPSGFDVFISVWMQHCLHSWTMVVAVVDLFLVPRWKPADTSGEIRALYIFMAVYFGTLLIVHDLTGYWPYPFFEFLSPLRIFLFWFGSCFCVVALYHAQWLIIDHLWSGKTSDFPNMDKDAGKLN